MTIQGAIFNMRGQLCHRHANVTALYSSSVVSALGLQARQPRFLSWPGQGVVPLRHAGKKSVSSVFLLG